MTETLTHITLETGKNPQYAIIWLHGLGADGEDFVPIVDEFTLPVAIRYIFPHAPRRPVTINGGFVMRAWYDITSEDIGAQQDEAGIRRSQAEIEALIAKEIARGIKPEHIFLVGFSQGGAVALLTALNQIVPLAGVIALSTYLPLAESIATDPTANSRLTPIFMAHGSRDPIIPIALGFSSMKNLQSLGYAVEWHEYAMQHSVNEAELRDIEAWLKNRIED